MHKNGIEEQERVRDILFQKFSFNSTAFAKLTAFQIEPVPGSCERITCIVASIGSDKTYKILQTISEVALNKLFGTGWKVISKLIEFEVLSLEAHFKECNDFSNYMPVIPTIHKGNSETLYGKSVEQSVKAFLSDNISYTHFYNTLEDKPVKKSDNMSSRWFKEIKQGVLESNKSYSLNFKVELANSGHRYDFVRGRYIANFSVMNPLRAEQSLSESKKKLWDLGVANRYYTEEVNREMLMYVPNKNSIEYSKKEFNNAFFLLEQLTQEADEKKIRLQTFSSSTKASKRIIELAY